MFKMKEITLQFRPSDVTLASMLIVCEHGSTFEVARTYQHQDISAIFEHMKEIYQSLARVLEVNQLEAR